ncbi:hypothetical protein BHM03_00033305, partial [Ensete ventricosum]
EKYPLWPPHVRGRARATRREPTFPDRSWAPPHDGGPVDLAVGGLRVSRHALRWDVNNGAPNRLHVTPISSHAADRRDWLSTCCFGQPAVRLSHLAGNMSRSTRQRLLHAEILGVAPAIALPRAREKRDTIDSSPAAVPLMSTPASVVAGTPADHGGVPPTSAAEIMPRSPLDKPLAELTQGDIAQLTRDDARRFLKSKGMRRPSWNKSQAIQQVISLKGLLEGTPGCDNCPAGVGIFQKSSPPPARVFPLQVVILCFSFIHKVPKQRPYSHPISCFFSPGLVSSRSEVRRRIAAAGEGAVTVPEEGSDPSVLLRRSGPPSPAGGSLPLSQMTIVYDGVVNVYDGLPLDQVSSRISCSPVTDDALHADTAPLCLAGEGGPGARGQRGLLRRPNRSGFSGLPPHLRSPRAGPHSALVGQNFPSSSVRQGGPPCGGRLGGTERHATSGA